MRDYTKYEVWQKDHEFTLFIYQEILPLLPASEKYDLYSQLKRAAYSIPLNISEGCGRNSDKDFAHFLDNAMGSVNEAEYCGLLVKDLSYISYERYRQLYTFTNEIESKLINLIKKIRSGS
ncbi:MAG: four helix bundle protein [Niabella sp.]